jgi:uncharacterized lipoprotein NlpE involved in copper resistance
MKIVTMPLSQKLILILLSTLAFNQAYAASDMQTKQGAKVEQTKDHSKHQQHRSESQEYRGVFFGFVPCKDCEGIKTTLSLKNRNNYLLVTQVAKTSSREYFEKGKYNWDEKTNILTLTPRKKSEIRKYRINDEKTLVQLSSTGNPLKSNQKNTSYVLLKNKNVRKSATMHMH